MLQITKNPESYTMMLWAHHSSVKTKQGLSFWPGEVMQDAWLSARIQMVAFPRALVGPQASSPHLGQGDRHSHRWHRHGCSLCWRHCSAPGACCSPAAQHMAWKAHPCAPAPFRRPLETSRKVLPGWPSPRLFPKPVLSKRTGISDTGMDQARFSP